MQNVTEQLEKYSELATYDVTEATLAKLYEEATGIKLVDWQDEVNYAEAKKAHRHTRKLWNAIETRRKELNKFPAGLKAQIDNKAKKLQGEIDKSTKVLEEQINIRDLELERQKQEEQAAREAIRTKRAEQLKELGEDEAIYMLDPEFCDESKFEKILSQAIVNFKNRQDQQSREVNLRLSLERVASSPKGQRIAELCREFIKIEDAIERIYQLEIELAKERESL